MQSSEITHAPGGDGERHHLDTRFPLIDRDGNVYGVGCISHDITPLKLNEQQLQERQRELMAAIKARDDFISIASHEIKTPLTSMLMQLEILDSGSGSLSCTRWSPCTAAPSASRANPDRAPALS